MNISLVKEVFAQHLPGREKISIGPEFGFGVFGTLGSFITVIIPLFFSIVATLVAFYFLIGAFELITSQGDKAHIVSARSKIYHAIIGLILLLLLYSVTRFILDTFGLTGLGII